LILAGAGTYGWASHRDHVLLTRKIQTHRVGFPIPFPLSTDEVVELRRERGAKGAGGADPSQAELDSLALERARERGQHLVDARYGCIGCHGKDFGGGIMVDNALIGHILAPNITAGAGGRTAAYTAVDWDRIVRHGVKPDSTPAAMPSEDFQYMTDRELSDIIVYIRSKPTVDATVARPSLGPLGTVLMATGQMRLAADVIPDHMKPHPVQPPVAEATAAFGRHLTGTCRGCHRQDFTGGPIAGGDPSWPPAANLTPHADGLAGWTYEMFATTLRTGKKPDGTELREPMSEMVPMAQRMTDVELQAIWAYLQSLPPKPSPKK
jgi:mono/diheme cytochrome c family protein